jgi:CysZ protein
MPTRQTGIAAFFEGVRVPFTGMAYLRKNRDLWHLVVLPVTINLLLTLLLLTGLVLSSYYALTYMHSWPYFATAALGRVQEIFAAIFVIALLMVCTVASYLFLSGIFSGLLNERLAIAVERKLGTPPGDLKPTSFQYQVIDSFRDLAAMLGMAAFSLMIGCIPVIGAVLGPVLNLYVDWRVLGFDYLDIPMSLRGLPRAEKRAFAKTHRAQQLGLGAAAFVLNLVPFLGSLLLTTATIGAVLLYHRLREGDRLLVDAATFSERSITPGKPGAI